MKYTLLAAILIAFTFTLTACGEPKPGQYPPSLYKDKDSKEGDGK